MSQLTAVGSNVKEKGCVEPVEKAQSSFSNGTVKVILIIGTFPWL